MIASERTRRSDTNKLLEIIISTSGWQNFIALYTSICERGPNPNRNFEDVMYKYYLVTLEDQREEFRQTAGTCLDNEPAFIPLIQSSLETCRTSHPDCHRKRSGISAPLKVIDCQSRTLCTIDSNTLYAALSYVWGDAPTEPLLDPRIFPIPKTIEDALVVCLRVGMQYLWVDRYCIDQGNPEEKHTLISQMDKIYRGAELTIIAAAGENPNHGLPGVNGTSLRRRIELKTRSFSYVASRPRYWQVASSTWSKRGWTYQEVLLSRRRLYFTESDILFECQSLRAQAMFSEDSVSIMPPGSLIYSWLEPDHSFHEIYMLLDAYCHRHLTYSEDAIHGVEAILRSFQFTYDPHWPFGAREGKQTMKHFYGAPCASHQPSRNVSFLTSLLWCGTSLKFSAESLQKFPSWSWAITKTSAQGSARFPTGRCIATKQR